MKRRHFIFGAAGVFGGLASIGYFSLCAADKNKEIKHQLISYKTRPRLGINLSSISYWSSEMPFNDILKNSGDWVSNSEGKKWGEGPALDLDDFGWVKKLEPKCEAVKMIAPADIYPTGEYTILYDGEGEFKIGFDIAKLVKISSGIVKMHIIKLGMPLALAITKINPQNPLRNIRILLPGFAGDSNLEIWRPNYLKRWSGVACIRFMNYMQTNNSKQKNWDDRPKMGFSTYAPGMPLELMVDLANRLNADAWFCIPHMADDDYVKNFIGYVNEHLNPGLKAWIEYSNEVWNNIFLQSKYVGEIGMQKGLAKTPWEASWYAYAQRSIEIFKIVGSINSSKQRFVNVIASQAANSYVSEKILGYQDVAKYADVLAIAPYFSFNVNTTDVLNDKEVANWSLDKLFTHLEMVSLPQAQAWMEASKKVADKYNLSLVAYEAGQHLIGYWGAENNEKLVDLFTRANIDPSMGELYVKYLKSWDSIGGGLLCAFESMGKASKWGAWGLLQTPNEDPKLSPKFKAVVEWAQSKGQKMSF